MPVKVIPSINRVLNMINITNINNQPPILTRSPKRAHFFSGAQLAAVCMLPPFDGFIISAPTLVADAPTAEARNTGGVPAVAIEAIAPAPNEPPPIMAAFFRLVHPTRTNCKLQIPR